MTGNEYQELAMRTATELSQIEGTRHGLLMLASEAGECCGLLQKTYQGHELILTELMRELGDVLWAVARVCAANKISMDQVMHANIEKLKARYPNGFEVARSLNREGE